VGYVESINSNTLEEENIEWQTQVLSRAACKDEEQSEECRSKWTSYWPQIVLSLVPKFLEPTRACVGVNLCTRTNIALQPNSHECVDTMMLVTHNLHSDENTQLIIDFLKGDGLCAEEGNTLECAVDMENHMPQLLIQFAKMIRELVMDICYAT